MNGGKFHFRDTKVHKILVNANKRNKIYKIFFVSPLYMSDFVFYIENDTLLTSEEYFFPVKIYHCPSSANTYVNF